MVLYFDKSDDFYQSLTISKQFEKTIHLRENACQIIHLEENLKD